MRGISQFLGAVAFVGVLALIQNCTHGNRSWAGAFSDLPSCERFHTALVQSSDAHPQANTSVPTPIFNPPIIPKTQSFIPVLLSQTLITEVDTFFRPKSYLFFPTGLSPPAPKVS